MNGLAERRHEEKERRRSEILDATETVAATHGWDEMTMDQVARRARLSRALLYVYFTDKTDLMFGIGQRAMATLTERFSQSTAAAQRGIEQLEAIGRTYVAYAQEFPVQFGVLARCELHSPVGSETPGNEGEWARRGDALHSQIVATLETGIRDGSIRSDVGHPATAAIVLWGFLHGVIQVSASKANLLGHRGVSIKHVLDHALVMASRSVATAI